MSTLKEARSKRRLFIGREIQQGDFRLNFSLSSDDERRYFIFNIFGQGGIGKTQLTKRFQKIAQDEGAITAYTDEAQTTILDIMRYFAEQMEKQDVPLKTYMQRDRLYRQKCQELESDPHLPNGFSTLFFTTLFKTAQSVAKTTPAGPIADAFDADATGAQISSWIEFIAKKLSNKDEQLLVRQPVQVLTPLFVQDLKKAIRDRAICLFFDTYAETGKYIEGWLISLLNEDFGPIPDTLTITIAGREQLDQNQWKDHLDIIKWLPLDLFTEQEIYYFLQEKSISNDDVAEIIIRLSGRLPLLVAMLAAESPTAPDQIREPSASAVECFLKWSDDSVQRKAALHCSLPRFLNQDVLTLIVGQDQSEKTFDWLRNMPFVSKPTFGNPRFEYHSVVRELMLRYLWMVSPNECGQLHEKLAIFYAKARDKMALDKISGLRNPTWLAYDMESMYHQLCQMPHQHLPEAINGFLELASLVGFFPQQITLSYIETLQQSGRDGRNDEVEQTIHWGKLLEKVINAYHDGHIQDRIDIFTEMINYSAIDPCWHPLLLAWRGNSLRQLRRFDQALNDLNQAINLQPDLGMAYASRGSAFLELGAYQLAIADCTKALEFPLDEFRWKRWILVRRGIAYSRLQSFGGALQDLNQAITIDPNLGWAILNRGIIFMRTGVYDNALRDFDKAIDLAYNEANLWQTFGQRGELHLFMRHLDQALSDLTSAIELKPDFDWPLYVRFMVYALLGNTDLAQKDLARVTELASLRRQTKPESLYNTLNLALYYLADKNIEEAEKLCNEAIKMGATPHHIREFMYDLGNFLILFPDHECAIKFNAQYKEHFLKLI